MGEFPRKSDGRRVFTVEFKRGVVQQLLKGEKTLAEVSRELDIQPSVVRQWKRRFEAGATAAEILEGRRHEDLHGASRVRGRVVQSNGALSARHMAPAQAGPGSRRGPRRS